MSRIVRYVVAAAALVLLSGACMIQGLYRARIGLACRLDSPADPRVTLSVTRPGGYGLTASERREGWPELNQVVAREVMLDRPSFEIDLPPASYCVTRFLWQPPPPPPAVFVLRFSDAPDEEYIVWSFEESSGYAVHDWERTSIPKDRATWKLRPGALRPQGPEGPDRLWLLPVELERQREPARRDTDAAATATARGRLPARTLEVPGIGLAARRTAIARGPHALRGRLYDAAVGPELRRAQPRGFPA